MKSEILVANNPTKNGAAGMRKVSGVRVGSDRYEPMQKEFPQITSTSQDWKANSKRNASVLNAY